MFNEDDEANLQYTVVVNHEEQYSIWPADRTMPDGWREVGKNGVKADCLTYIDQVWTDMRPLSLRMHMERERQRAESDAASMPAAPQQRPIVP
jgi:MbtH protein